MVNLAGNRAQHLDCSVPCGLAVQFGWKHCFKKKKVQKEAKRARQRELCLGSIRGAASTLNLAVFKNFQVMEVFPPYRI
jgi:hypothetical protein